MKTHLNLLKGRDISRLLAILLSVSLAPPPSLGGPAPACALHPEEPPQSKSVTAGLEEALHRTKPAPTNVSPDTGLEEEGKDDADKEKKAQKPKDPNQGLSRRGFLRGSGLAAARVAVLGGKTSSIPELTDPQFEATERFLEVSRRIDVGGFSELMEGFDFGEFAQEKRIAEAAIQTLPTGNLYRRKFENALQTFNSLLQGCLELEPSHPYGLSRHSYVMAKAVQIALEGKDISLWFTIDEEARNIRDLPGHSGLSLVKEYERAVAAGLTPGNYSQNVQNYYVDPLIRLATRQARTRLSELGITDPAEAESLLSQLPGRLKSSSHSDQTLEQWVSDWVRAQRYRVFEDRSQIIRKALKDRFGRFYKPVGSAEGMDAAISLDEAVHRFEAQTEEASVRNQLTHQLSAALRRQHRLGAGVSKRQYKNELAQVDEMGLDQLRDLSSRDYIQQRLDQFPIPDIAKEFLQGVSSSSIGWLAARLAQAASSGPIELRILVNLDGSLLGMRWRGPDGLGRVPNERIQDLQDRDNWNVLDSGEPRRYLSQPGHDYRIEIPQGISASTLEHQLRNRAWWDYPRSREMGAVPVAFQSAIITPPPQNLSTGGLEEQALVTPVRVPPVSFQHYGGLFQDRDPNKVVIDPWVGSRLNTTVGRHETWVMTGLEESADVPSDRPIFSIQILHQGGARLPAVFEGIALVDLPVDLKEAENVLQEAAERGIKVALLYERIARSEKWDDLLRRYGMTGILTTLANVQAINNLREGEISKLLALLQSQGTGLIRQVGLEEQTTGERTLFLYE